MSLKDDSKKVIGPSKELREKMKQLNQAPPPTYEQMEEQFRRCKERRQSPEYQAKYNNKFNEVGRRRRGGDHCWEYTEEDLRVLEEWNKKVEAERKQRRS